ncbi:hypothetical protein [Novosphingobium mangrovi (ex Huang et al. 2023)]|uniref:Uncharacterized protein n=1 Tax=Novosphingobium mangrovi (ex Huang et al. 2023) TaxID=2976432 RepID=A0ABT2I9N4_9SPHN|nr:hypothetical protein [Novosphingobium mangrovi (ex Huang et al. 2023)]MCT2401217.1 hypothetical protein [Novosphingobium mangrovi (ex Huang et al. 2023)]
MTAAPIPCTRHDRVGTDDPLLRRVLAGAGTRHGCELTPLLLALYMHEGQLLATWKCRKDLKSGSAALDAAWHAEEGEGTILHLVPSDAEYDYQEEVMENPFQD